MDTTSIIIMIVAVLVVGGIIYYFTKKVTLEQATLAAQQAIQKAVTDERIAAEAAQKAAITKSLDDAKIAASAAQTAAVSKAVADQKVADLAECNARVSKELADQKVKLDSTCKASLDKAIADAKLASDAALKAAITKTTADIQAAADAAQKAAVSKAIAEAQAAAREAQGDATRAQQAAVAKAVADAKVASDAVLRAKISEIEAKAKVDLLNYDPRMINCSPTDILNYDCFINRLYNKIILSPNFTKLPDDLENKIKNYFIMSKSEFTKGMSNELGKKTVQDIDDEIDRLFAEKIPPPKLTLDEIRKISCKPDDMLSYECALQVLVNIKDDFESKNIPLPSNLGTSINDNINQNHNKFMFIQSIKDFNKITVKTYKEQMYKLIDFLTEINKPTTTQSSTKMNIRYNNLYRIMTSRLNLQP